MNSKTINRAANASIKGYLYQFDRTIIELLNANNDTTIVVEGIEDIDLEISGRTEAVQCKYLEAAKFSLAVIRPAVLAMLTSSIDNQAIKYRLYIHCGKDGVIPSSINLDDLKICLTSKSRDGAVTLHYDGFDDKQLSSFAARLSIVAGESFDKNREQVHTMIQSALRCTEADSKDLYYGNALATINSFAIQGNIDKRKTKRADFLKAIDKKEVLYTRWHKEVVGVEKYIAMLKRYAKANKLFDPLKSRFLVIDTLDEFSVGEYISIITTLARDHYGIGKLSTARPWTVVMSCEQSVLEEVKRGLIASEIVYNDGFEAVSFSKTLFDRWPIVNTTNKTGRIGATSYDVRLISSAAYTDAVKDLALPDRVVAISNRGLSHYGWATMPQALQIDNVSANHIKELLGV